MQDRRNSIANALELRYICLLACAHDLLCKFIIDTRLLFCWIYLHLGSASVAFSLEYLYGLNSVLLNAWSRLTLTKMTKMIIEWNSSSLVLVRACCLFGARSLLAPMIRWWPDGVGTPGTNFNGNWIKLQILFFQKYRPFFSNPLCVTLFTLPSYKHLVLPACLFLVMTF